LKVSDAPTVVFNKRSLASGYAEIKNPLFYRDNTMMILANGKARGWQNAKNSNFLAGYFFLG
jgi:NAD(P) transhydrogenase subunit beta